MLIHTLLATLSVGLPLVHPSRILAVVPTISRSHFDVFQPLLLALASRGHHVIVISSFPQSPPAQNYTDIDLRGYKTTFSSNIDFGELPHLPVTFQQNHRFLMDEIHDYEHALSHPEVKRLLASKERFDLVVTEFFNSDVFLGFAHRFDAPVIAMSSCPLFPWSNSRFGNPDSPSFIPNMFVGKAWNLDYPQRIYNTYQLVASKLLYKYSYNAISERIAKKVFGESLPPLEVLATNTSLLLVNTHHSLHGARPLSPQVIQIGGIHVKEPKPLHRELDKWMNESTDGVVYFSFGSMLRGSTLPQDKVNAFLQVFATLPQRVLWKWEDDAVNGLPANVKIMKWLPQRDVLAHPKVKVFISHGGLLGTTEAVVSGVPILGIPMYGDQPNNVAALVENGVAVHVDYNNISVASLSYALNTLVHDKRYSENAKLLSRRFLDRPQSPLETAVYWTEYVIRHRGAPHLQSAAVHLPWYQYYLLDVAAVCLAGLLFMLALIFYILRFCLRLVISTKSTKLKTN